jgi:hypothetical protein
MQIQVKTDGMQLGGKFTQNLLVNMVLERKL